MTSAHFIYIPLVVVGGIVIGFFLGARAARDRIAFEKKREETRAAAKAAREARRKEPGSAGDPPA